MNVFTRIENGKRVLDVNEDFSIDECIFDLLKEYNFTFVKNGERFIGNDRLTLTGNTTNRGDGNALVVGDRLIGQNSGANAAIISISGSVYALANNL